MDGEAKGWGQLEGLRQTQHLQQVPIHIQLLLITPRLRRLRCPLTLTYQQVATLVILTKVTKYLELDISTCTEAVPIHLQHPPRVAGLLTITLAALLILQQIIPTLWG